jgi:uncharacterized protein
MKILLIGATGMIGSRILTEAVSRGHEVIAAARKPEGVMASKGVTTAHLDASDAAQVIELAQDTDVIIAATAPRSTGNALAEATGVGRAVMQAAAAQAGG